jgi:AraC-like DNA-binding protein
MPEESPLLDRVTLEHWIWFFEGVNLTTAQRKDALRRRLEAARIFLDENLGEPLTLSAAARRAHLSKYHFLRLFKQTYHETPLRYLRRRRLEHARRLLTGTYVPVTSVCLHVGFESLGSFSTLFRRSTGASPAIYRRRYITIPRSVIPAERLIPCCWLRRYGVTAESTSTFPRIRNPEEAAAEARS